MKEKKTRKRYNELQTKILDKCHQKEYQDYFKNIVFDMNIFQIQYEIKKLDTEHRTISFDEENYESKRMIRTRLKGLKAYLKGIEGSLWDDRQNINQKLYDIRSEIDYLISYHHGEFKSRKLEELKSEEDRLIRIKNEMDLDLRPAWEREQPREEALTELDTRIQLSDNTISDIDINSFFASGSGDHIRRNDPPRDNFYYDPYTGKVKDTSYVLD